MVIVGGLKRNSVRGFEEISGGFGTISYLASPSVHVRDLS